MDEPLFEGTDKPLHVCECGCMLTDVVDRGVDGKPVCYWQLCPEHEDLHPEFTSKKERRRNKRLK